MKLAEKIILRRINNCLKIPAFSGGGTQSSSIRGIMKYAHDCNEALPKIRGIITLMCIGESYDGEIEEDLRELESWSNKRESENWQ